MDIERIRKSLNLLEENKTVIAAHYLLGTIDGEIRAFVKLVLPLPYSADRETECIRLAREAAGSSTIPVFIDYAVEGEHHE